MNQTLVLLKPESLQRGLAGELISRLERRGLTIAAMKMLWLGRETAERHYDIHRDKPFFAGLVAHICSGPLIACVFRGENAVSVVRQTMGETDPAHAAPGTIRGDLALHIGRNLIHGSDSEESAEKEIALFFSPEELLSYQRDGERWVTEC